MAAPNSSAQWIISALANHPKLLMKRRIMSFGDHYDVMDENQNVLCTVGLDAKQNMTGQLVGAAVGAVAGGIVGSWAQRSRQYTYTVKDPQGNVGMLVNKGPGGYKARFDIVDPANGGGFGYINIKRGFLGGMKAHWFSPQGQEMMSTKGNIIRRKYAIMDGGGQEIGRVRHKILAIRDVWQLEFEGSSNHLYSAIFAAVLDFEKKK